MNNLKPKKNFFEKIKFGTAELPHQNLFKGIAKGFIESIGKLPGPMTVIIITAASIAILTGVIGQIMLNKRAAENTYLPLRLEVDSAKPAINTEFLRGQWIYQDKVQTLTIRFGVDVFELIQRRKDESFTRYYVRGGYRTVGNILILQTREDLGAAFDLTRPELRFLPLEFDILNIETELTQTIMLWRIPKVERSKMNTALQDEFPMADTRPMAFQKVRIQTP